MSRINQRRKVGILMDLLFLSGSSQVGSANWRLPALAADLTQHNFGNDVAVSVIDLSAFGLPIFSESDRNQRELPPEVASLRKQLSVADGLFVSSDEYTGAYSAILRNALRWLSVLETESETPLRDMPTALCGTSSRGIGALRGQPALGQLLIELGASVFPQYLEIGTAPGLFDEQGRLHRRFERQLVQGCLAKLVQAAKKRHPQRHVVQLL